VDFEREGAAETLVSRYSTLRLFYLLLIKNYDDVNGKILRKVLKQTKSQQVCCKPATAYIEKQQ